MDIREAKVKDLNGLLELYTPLHNNSIPKVNQDLSELWNGILQDRNHHIIVAEKDNGIYSVAVIEHRVG